MFTRIMKLGTRLRLSGNGWLRPAFGRHHGESFVRKEAVPHSLIELAALEATQVLERPGTSPQGLSPDTAAQRLRECGKNEIAHEARRTLLAQLWKRLLNPLNILLLTLATVSLLTGDRQAAVIIVVMVVLSLSLAIAQERRSGKAAEQLRAMVHTKATVVRAGGLARAGAGTSFNLAGEYSYGTRRVLPARAHLAFAARLRAPWLGAGRRAHSPW